MGICCSSEKKGSNYKKTMLNYKDLKATYHLDPKILGKGSFGTVYKGINKKNKDQKIAIKAIDKNNLTPKECEEIHDEIKLLEQVDHPNIVNYFETYEDKRFVYLCMELCQGGELIQEVMSYKAEFDEKRASEIMYQLLGALNHVHSNKVIHRDIKPENIMFDREGGTVKFIDFGLACQFKPGKKDLAGTPYFIAPEVLTGVYGYECDIWSMGVVLFMMMTGAMPFDGNSQEELFRVIRSGRYKMPSHFSPDL